MSIASAISSAQTKVAAAYTACNDKGATMPAAGSQNLSNLASTISSITTSGGSPRLVTSTFTANSSSGAQTVTIPYTGSCYPIAAVVYPDGGMSSANSIWYNTIDNYAIGFWAFIKTHQDTSPTFETSGDANAGVTMATYKNSSSSATSYARAGSVGINTFSSSNATAATTTCVRFKSATTMSVFVAGTSYGFMPGVTYRYHIIYSDDA